MDRHDFIRHSLILEEMEEEEKKNAEKKKETETASNDNQGTASNVSQGGWPMGVRLINADDDIEW